MVPAFWTFALFSGMSKILALVFAVSGVVTAIGCADHTTQPNPLGPPPPPPPGSAVVSLTTPNTDDGAVVVTLSGPGLTTMQVASSSNLFYSRAVSDSEARVILVGNLTAGPLFTFKLADGQQISAYSATVGQVATRADALQASTTGYKLSIAAAP